MSIKRKARPIKNDGNIIALQVEKDRLESDFDGYYKNTRKLLDADRIQIKNYDEETVIMYDRDKEYESD